MPSKTPRRKYFSQKKTARKKPAKLPPEELRFRKASDKADKFLKEVQIGLRAVPHYGSSLGIELRFARAAFRNAYNAQLIVEEEFKNAEQAKIAGKFESLVKEEREILLKYLKGITRTPLEKRVRDALILAGVIKLPRDEMESYR